MGCVNIIRAIIVRLCFACHGLLAIFLLTVTANNSKYWLLATALGGLLVESIVTLCKKRGREWKWFCPSVFFYLLSVVPAIWFLELHALEKRIAFQQTLNTTSALISPNDTDDIARSLRSGLGVEIKIQMPMNLWIKIIEQCLLLLLILGRWILPKGKLTHDQLSQLLLVYIGTAADIVEFFDAFKEEEVRHDRLLCHIILSIWSWSLLQFTMVLTATRARKDQSGIISRNSRTNGRACCTADVYGIVISIFMQDAPFLVLRLVLIFHYDVLSYTNMFFTAKNTLVILLLMYRLVVVQIALYDRAHRNKSSSAKRRSTEGLLNGYSELWNSQLPGTCACAKENGFGKKLTDDLQLDFFNYYDKTGLSVTSQGRSVWDPVAERCPSVSMPRHDPCTSFTLMLQASKTINEYRRQRRLQGDIIITHKRVSEERRVSCFDDNEVGTTLHMIA